MKISIFGLGYVGAVSLACLVRDGHQVTGVDIDPTKLALIRDGQTPIIEAGMQELMREVAASGRVEVSSDVSYGVHNTLLSFICVGTPSQANGGQDLGAIIRLAEQLGVALRDKDEYHVFVVRSTVSPGTVEEIIQPILESHSGKKVGEHFGLCFQPEFLREGSSIKDYDNPPYTVVGGDSARSVQVVHDLFQHLPCEFISPTIRTAEMLKYCCNVFHALKATFANEIGRVSQSLGVDSHEVMDLVCRDTRLNISRAYMRPGFAFGGSCLPKDLRALLRVAQDHDVTMPMLAGILPSNRLHIDHAIEMVQASGKKSVGMIGLSFKTGTDDLRESPLVALAEAFIGKGLKLEIYDPFVNIARLVGANRRYIEESIPHISSLMRADCRAVLDAAEIIIVGISDAETLRILADGVREDQLLIDLVGIRDQLPLSGTYQGVCW